jgi:homoserine kinase
VTARALVRVPGSTSNLGAGFDCVGAAVDRWLTASLALRDEPGIVIERAGTLAQVAVAPDDDRLVAGVRAACAAADRPVPAGLHVRASSQIPIARGLGSSAAAVVAGAAAINELLGLDLDDRTLVAAAARVEGHPDNVAPALFGGAVLAVAAPGSPADGPLLVVPLDVHPGVALAFAVPDFPVETRHARAVLPDALPHRTAVRAAALGAALVRGLATGDGALLAAAMEDVLHVPFRTQLVAGFEAVTAAARAAGAYGATLSGSGSTVVALAPAERAAVVADAMRDAWSDAGVTAATFVNPPRVEGCAVAVRQDCPD